MDYANLIGRCCGEFPQLLDCILMACDGHPPQHIAVGELFEQVILAFH